MATPCDIKKNELETIIDNEESKQEYFDKNSKVNKILDEGKELQDILDNEFPKGRFIDPSVVNERMNKLYGPMAKARKLAIQIRALMNANETLAEVILQFAIEHIGQNQKVGTAVKKDKNGNLVQVERHIVLSRFPISSLKVIYKEALKPTHATEGMGMMNFNGILTPLITPKQRGAKEPSGGFWIMQRAVTNYANRISHRIKRFTSQYKEKGKEVWTGMNNVYTSIRNLQAYHPQNTDPKLGEKYIAFFSRFMDGRIFQNEAGEWMVLADYGPITDEENFTKTYKTTKDVIFGYQNPVLLEEFTPPNRKKGEWHIEMPVFFDKDGNETGARKEFFKLANEARKIDDAALPYFEDAMKGSLEEIANQLHQGFPNLKREEVFQIMFRNKNEKSKKLSEKILEKLTPEQKETYEMLYTTFEPMVQDEFIIVTGSKVEYRKNHWPGQFNEDLFKPLLDKLIMELDNTVESLKELHVNKKDANEDPFNKQQLAALWKEIQMYSSKLNYARVVSKKLDGYPVDLIQNFIVSLSNDNKYFKRISNAYDRRQVRVDDAVYFDYLKSMAATVERNYLVAALVKSIVTSKLNNSKKMHEIVARASINHFKVPFHGTDVYRTGFLTRLFPFLPSTTEEYNNALNWIPGRDKTAAQLNKTFRFISSYLSGTYLHGFGTTVQNMTDSLRNIIYSSFDEFKNSMADLRDSSKKADIERIIDMAGFTEFSDFFSRSMVNGIVEKQMEAAIADGILKAMMDFANGNIKATSSQKKKNLKKFNDTVTELLSKSESIFSPEDFLKPHMTKEQLKQRRKTIKQNRRVFFANKLVQFAIEKEFAFRDAIKQKPWTKFSKMTASAAVEAYIHVTSIGKRITMSSTERWIRSVSFVVGLNRAQKAGLLRQDIPWYKFEDMKDINEAIAIGRNYQEKVNFGLSTQAMGEYYYNGWGMLQGKFKYWANQKFGADVRLWAEAYTSVKDMEKIKSNAFDFKAIGKMFYTLSRHGGKTLRTTHPEIAALKRFMLTQLPLTVLIDVVTLGLFPSLAALRGLRNVMYYGSGGKALRGFSSDLVSLSIAPFIILGLLLGDGFDDEEDLERTVKYYMRRTFFGFVPMWAFDNILALVSLMVDATKQGIEGLIDASSVFRGGTLPWNKLINKIAKKVIED